MMEKYRSVKCLEETKNSWPGQNGERRGEEEVRERFSLYASACRLDFIFSGKESIVSPETYTEKEKHVTMS